MKKFFIKKGAPRDCRIGECPVAIFGDDLVDVDLENGEYLLGTPYLLISENEKLKIFPPKPPVIKVLTKKDVKNLNKKKGFFLVINENKDLVCICELTKKDIEEIKELWCLYQKFIKLPKKEKKRLVKEIFGDFRDYESIIKPKKVLVDFEEGKFSEVELDYFIEIYYCLLELKDLERENLKDCLR